MKEKKKKKALTKTGFDLMENQYRYSQGRLWYAIRKQKFVGFQALLLHIPTCDISPYESNLPEAFIYTEHNPVWVLFHGSARWSNSLPLKEAPYMIGNAYVELPWLRKWIEGSQIHPPTKFFRRRIFAK